MKLRDWIVWACSTVLVADLIVFAMAARGKFSPVQKEDPAIVAYQWKVEKALNNVMQACTAAATSVPYIDSEFKNTLLVVRRIRKIRAEHAADIAKSHSNLREIATELEPGVKELDTFLRSIESPWPHWKPIRNAVNELAKLTRTK